MTGPRGVHQVPSAGHVIQLNLTTSRGTVPLTLLIDPDEVAPEYRRRLIAVVRAWMDEVDPPVRLLAAEAGELPAPLDPRFP